MAIAVQEGTSCLEYLSYRDGAHARMVVKFVQPIVEALAWHASHVGHQGNVSVRIAPGPESVVVYGSVEVNGGYSLGNSQV
jgi:hypothetical protein